MKYGIWNIQAPEPGAVNALVSGGYAPLPAMVLASRGMTDPRKACAYLDCNAELYDPFLMTDMDKAVERVCLRNNYAYAIDTDKAAYRFVNPVFGVDITTLIIEEIMSPAPVETAVDEAVESAVKTENGDAAAEESVAETPEEQATAVPVIEIITE